MCFMGVGLCVLWGWDYVFWVVIYKKLHSCYIQILGVTFLADYFFICAKRLVLRLFYLRLQIYILIC